MYLIVFLFLFGILGFACKEILTLVVVTHEETPLVLQVEVRRETIRHNLVDNFLLDFLIVNLRSSIEFFTMVVREVKQRCKYCHRSRTCGVHVTLAYCACVVV